MVFAHVFLGLGVAVFGGEFHVFDDLSMVLLDKEPLHVHESEGVLGVGVVALGGIGEPVVGLFVVDLDPGAVEVDVAQAVGRLGFTHLSRLQQRGDGLGVPFDVAQVDATLQKLVAEALGHACLSAGLLELQGLLVEFAGLGGGIVLGCHLLDGNAHESLVGNVGMFALGDMGQIGDGLFVSVFLSRLHVEFGNGLDGVDISSLGRFLEILLGLLQVGADYPLGLVVGQTQEVVGVGDLQGLGLAEVVHRLEFVHLGAAAVEVELAQFAEADAVVELGAPLAPVEEFAQAVGVVLDVADDLVDGIDVVALGSFDVELELAAGEGGGGLSALNELGYLEVGGREALLGRGQIEAPGLRLVDRGAEAPFVHGGQVVEPEAVAQVGRLGEPAECLGIAFVVGHVVVDEGQPVHAVGVPHLRGTVVGLLCLLEVLVFLVELIEKAQFEVGVDILLVEGALYPLESFVRVAPFHLEVGELDHRPLVVALFGQLAICLFGLFPVYGQAVAVFLHVGNLAQGHDVVLGGGIFVVGEGRVVVLLDMDAVFVHVAQQVLGVGVAFLGRFLEPFVGLPVVAPFQAAPIVDPPHDDLGEVHALFGIGKEGIQNFGPQLVAPHLVAEDVAEQMLSLDVVGDGQLQQHLRGLFVFVVAVELHGLLVDGRADSAAGGCHLVGALSFTPFGRSTGRAKFGPERSWLGLGLTLAEQLCLECLVYLRVDDVEDARNHVVPLGLVVEVVAQGLRLRGVNLPLVNPVDDAL